MRLLNLFFGAILGAAPVTLAKITTFSAEGRDDVFFSVAIPDATAASGSGPVLFQIKAPTSLQWVGFGQGDQMAGSNMFVVYSSSSSTNVTLSPRSGKGHVEPKFNPDAQVTLLSGSGVRDNVMTANVRCDNCLNWQGGSMNATSTSAPWLYAYKNGQSLNSNSVSEDIHFHDGYGGQYVDLSRAKTNSDNPFLNYDPSSATTSAAGPNAAGGSNMMAMLIAHGFLMSFAFVLLFPLFSLLVPLPIPISVAKVHAPLQLFTLSVAIAGMGLGINIAVKGPGMKHAHPIIGLVVMGLLILLQPAMGTLQHMHFRRTGGKSLFAYAHRWFGRCMITLGIINGGLGFDLKGVGTPGSPRGAMIAYSVIAGVMGLTYVIVNLAVAVRGRRRGDQAPEDEPKEISHGEQAESTAA
ncbi:CBD9-like protein [Aspergillus ambiguus]|uniref:cytochrome and DOMON domain-containing protein n=1 Tax=Aspergillus ambiguus TaxID=176160 RepID=UPI003CCE514F